MLVWDLSVNGPMYQYNNNDIINYFDPNIDQNQIEPYYEILEDNFSNASDTIFIPPSVDPLILDLNDNGIELIFLYDSNVYFDYNADSIKNITSWISPSDGFLVFDRNGDGRINDGSELFGDQTIKYDGTGKYLNGFESLAQEDSNNDGVIDINDTNWTLISIWRDLNSDGITEISELFSLEDLNI